MIFLYYASKDNAIDYLKPLLEHGADILAKYAWGRTPINRAFESHDIHCILLLLQITPIWKHGIAPMTRHLFSSQIARLPQSFFYRGDLSFVCALFDNGLDFHTLDRRGHTTSRMYIIAPQDLSFKGSRSSCQQHVCMCVCRIH